VLLTFNFVSSLFLPHLIPRLFCFALEVFAREEEQDGDVAVSCQVGIDINCTKRQSCICRVCE
jgi:hypothetical protein